MSWLTKIHKKKSEVSSAQIAFEKIDEGSSDITYEECLLAVSYNSRILAKIPPEHLTEEVCLKAIKNDYNGINVIKYVPDNMFTHSFVSLIVEQKGVFLKYIPSQHIDKEIILIAARQNVLSVKYIPETWRTDDTYIALFDINPRMLDYVDNLSRGFCEHIVSNKPTAIRFIKDMSAISKEMYAVAVKKDWRCFKYIPKKSVTKKLCKHAFEVNWKSFQYFPDKYKTQEMCQKVLEYDESFIRYCPPQMRTTDLCRFCLEKQGELLEFVPASIINPELCLAAIKQNSEAMRFVPEQYLTEAFYLRCFDANWKAVRFIPEELCTSQLYKTCLKRVVFAEEFTEWLRSGDSYHTLTTDYNSFKYLKKLSESIDYQSTNFDIVSVERTLGLRKTIASYYDMETGVFFICEELYKTAIKIEFSCFEQYYLHLCGNLQGADLTEYDFKDIDYNNYNLNGAYLNSKILIKLGKYNDSFYKSTIGKFSDKVEFMPVVSNETEEVGVIAHDEAIGEKLDSNERKVFYITDIHLNHKLLERFPEHATFDEIKLFIQKFTKNMVSKAYNRGDADYLLIGGDVSFCFEIATIFYAELSKIWQPSNIVVVLGNHELWGFDEKGNTKSSDVSDDLVNSTIGLYKTLFKELGINFLQNGLLVCRQCSTVLLTEHEILKKSAEELQEIALDGILKIYGGIGFSAYNPIYNATSGIYRQAITTLEKDLQYTKQGESVYCKLREVFPNDKLIVLTHMPLEDWSQDVPVPSWIYINGHTHNNHFLQTDRYTVYADNQVGYKAKSICLKYFCMGNDYDVFRYYKDGIYHISVEQYIEFNLGKNLHLNFSRDVDYILMLKREETYMFMLEDKEKDKLFLLNGGQIKRLNVTDVNYYYDNMVKYSQYINQNLKSYNRALKSISNAIKKLGGDGTVHGCIVDLDFYNHIFLNPQDGSIKAYFSPVFGSGLEFESVEALLQTNLPRLYANYVDMLQSGDYIVEPTVEDSSIDVIRELNTQQYKPSRLMKTLQHLTESNIIRVWNDDIVALSKQQPNGLTRSSPKYLPN